MAFDNDRSDKNIEKTKEILAIREAFLMIEGEFDCIDIFNYIRKSDAAKQIPIDNIADALVEFCKKGECKEVENQDKNKSKKYFKIISRPTI